MAPPTKKKKEPPAYIIKIGEKEITFESKSELIAYVKKLNRYAVRLNVEIEHNLTQATKQFKRANNELKKLSVKPQDKAYPRVFKAVLIDLNNAQNKLQETQKSIKKSKALQGFISRITSSLIRGIKRMIGVAPDRHLIDALRDVFQLKSKDRVSQERKNHYKHKIVDELLVGKMGLDPGSELIEQLTKNIMTTEDFRHFKRTMDVLTILAEYDIKKDRAIEFLNGAHFIVMDNAALFEKLRQVKGCQTRFSSHFKETRLQEFGINCGRIIPELLFLDSFQKGDPDKRPAFTHFQVEASPWRGKGAIEVTKSIAKNPQNIEHVPHAIGYFAYKTYRKLKGKVAKNLGAYGWSVHDDNNPIRLPPPKHSARK